MPAFVTHVTVDLDKLLEDGAAATCAFGCKACRVVIMAVDIAVVFVIRVLRSEEGGAEGASKVFDMELLVYLRIVSIRMFIRAVETRTYCMR